MIQQTKVTMKPLSFFLLAFQIKKAVLLPVSYHCHLSWNLASLIPFPQVRPLGFHRRALHLSLGPRKEEQGGVSGVPWSLAPRMPSIPHPATPTSLVHLLLTWLALSPLPAGSVYFSEPSSLRPSCLPGVVGAVVPSPGVRFGDLRK